jgi:hypothetical protein
MQARFALSPAKLLGALAVAVLLLCGTGRATANQVGYTLDVTTHYQFGAPAGNNGYSGSPDTGFVTITNNGTTTFTGTISDVAQANDGNDYSQSFAGVTLNPGDSFTFGTSPESSNVGGFNGPFGSVQPGITIQLNGQMNSTENVNLSVNDADIHSGSPRTNPFGDTLDSYVLQGGDDLGRDTGDGYETTQADGHFRFQEAAATPVPPSAILMGIGFAGLALRSLRGKLRGLVARKAS